MNCMTTAYIVFDSFVSPVKLCHHTAGVYSVSFVEGERVTTGL